MELEHDLIIAAMKRDQKAFNRAMIAVAFGFVGLLTLWCLSV